MATGLRGTVGKLALNFPQKKIRTKEMKAAAFEENHTWTWMILKTMTLSCQEHLVLPASAVWMEK